MAWLNIKPSLMNSDIISTHILFLPFDNDTNMCVREVIIEAISYHIK